MNNYSLFSEKQLIEHLKDADPDALSEVAVRYGEKLFDIAISIILEELLSKKVCLDTFVQLWDAKGKISPIQSLELTILEIFNPILEQNSDNAINEFIPEF